MGIHRRVYDKGVQRTYGIGSPSGSNRVISFDGSSNGALQTAYTHTGTITIYDVDVKNNVALIALLDSSGTAYKIVIGTISGTVITWGTAVTVVGPAGFFSACLNSTGTFALVSYAASGGTNDWKCKSYSISGTTPTLDQTLSVATGNSSTDHNAIASISATRACMFYEAQTTGYPTVIGLTFSAGSLTKDASPVTLESTALSGGSRGIYQTGTATWIACWGVSGAKPRYAPITDGTTSLTGGTVVQLFNNSSQVALSANSSGYAALEDITAGYAGGIISAGTISPEYKASTTNGFPLRWGSTGDWGSTLSLGRVASIGDVNGDGYFWSAAIMVNSTTFTAANGWINFLGVPTSDASAPVQVTKKIGTTLTNSATASSDKFIKGISTSQFLHLFRNTSDDIISLVVTM